MLTPLVCPWFSETSGLIAGHNKRIAFTLTRTAMEKNLLPDVDFAKLNMRAFFLEEVVRIALVGLWIAMLIMVLYYYSIIWMFVAIVPVREISIMLVEFVWYLNIKPYLERHGYLLTYTSARGNRLYAQASIIENVYRIFETKEEAYVKAKQIGKGSEPIHHMAHKPGDRDHYHIAKWHIRDRGVLIKPHYTYGNRRTKNDFIRDEDGRYHLVNSAPATSRTNVTERILDSASEIARTLQDYAKDVAGISPTAHVEVIHSWSWDEATRMDCLEVETSSPEKVLELSADSIRMVDKPPQLTVTKNSKRRRKRRNK